MSALPTAQRPEVLAPAGDRACLEAAVEAGADAVYFGLDQFNARARARNFSADSLAETMDYLRAHATRGYVALNTLVFDDELARLETGLRACADAGVDAVIVQDLGVLELARAVSPELPIHASTQMTCTDLGALELVRQLGASRVILPRELSLAEIEGLAKSSPLELEVFVHGALCVAYSGQCLTSEAIGGRSANRGACAQACRLPYELIVDGEKLDTGERAYLLSPGDLDGTPHVPDLVRMGVHGLKIEGRMKGPEYVTRTVRLYRAAVDAAMGDAKPPTPAEHDAAMLAYSRGSGPGFLLGVDHQRTVEGRTCSHRGVLIGECFGVASDRGRRSVRIKLASQLSRGDGLLVEGGYAGRGELGGRVWGITQRERDVESAEAGAEVLVWFGPEKHLGDLEPGRRVFKTSAGKGHEDVRASTPLSRLVRIDAHLTGRVDEAVHLEAHTADGRKAALELDTVLEQARSAPLESRAIREKLGKLGGTPFVLGDVVVDLPGQTTFAVSALNRARRALVTALSEQARCSYSTTERHWNDLVEAAGPTRDAPITQAGDPAASQASDEPRPEPPGGLFALCRTLPQAEAALEAGADGVYLDFLDLTGLADAVRALRVRSKALVGVAPPRIRKPEEERIDRFLGSLEPDLVLVRSLGSLEQDREAASRAGLESKGRGDELEPSPEGRSGARGAPLRIGDFSLNATNHVSAAALLRRGLSAFTPAHDLDAAQLVALLQGPLAARAEVMVHAPMPLFHMEHCVFAALLSKGRDFRTCGRPCEKHVVSLRDRTGRAHPLEADVGCRNTVFHESAQSAVDLIPSLVAAGVRRMRVELLREDAATARAVVGAYARAMRGTQAPADVLRELAALDDYRVVRGSLRVIGES